MCAGSNFANSLSSVNVLLERLRASLRVKKWDFFRAAC